MYILSSPKFMVYYHFFACPNLFYGVAFVERVFYFIWDYS